METKTTASKNTKPVKEKKQKVPKESAIYLRVTKEEEFMVTRLMQRYGKDKTNLILFALNRLRQRDNDAPPTDLTNRFVKPLLRLLSVLQTNPTLSSEHLELVKSTKTWASTYLKNTDEPLPDNQPTPPIPTRPGVSININTPEDFIDVDEIQAELKFMEDKISKLRVATYTLQQGDYRKEALDLLTLITQSHDALLEAIS